MAAAEVEVEEYNNRPHRALAKMRDPQTGRMRHMSPNEAWEAARGTGWEPMLAPPELVSDLMRPQVVRRTLRGEVTWDGNRYFLNDLRDIHGEDVRIAYDVRDASRVWVRTMDGELIGEALLDGNASDYMPMNRIEKGRERRAQGQLKRGIDKLENLTGQRVELVATTKAPSADLEPAALEEARRYAAALAAPSNTFEIPTDSMARYRLWKRVDRRITAGEQMEPEAHRWHGDYPRTDEFKSTQDMYDFAEAGLARA